MATTMQAPKGTLDILPQQVGKWQYVMEEAVDLAGIFGFQEIKTPMFEHTELFVRGVGDTTDVVQKEMYTFEDKGNRSITLRPEGTAGVIRACLEHGLLGDALPLKLCYNANCFRYENPQAGRYREFRQFGVELLGAESAAADAEVISLVDTLLKRLGVTDVHLEINSIGCPNCRPDYYKTLKAYFTEHGDKLCKTCLERLEKNPMRILDCKNPDCKVLAKNAPQSAEHLCAECDDHYHLLQSLLTSMKIGFTCNPKIVRGLDYYTKTVFEFVSDKIGSQGTICGGGRYDGLVESLGGKPTPAIGFGMGIERVIQVMDNCNVPFPAVPQCEIYFCCAGNLAEKKAMELTQQLRWQQYYAQMDFMQRSLKAQMRYANKIGAKYTMVLGDDEVGQGKGTLKNMATGKTHELCLDENFSEEFYQAMQQDERE